jgi:hypothetical protein
MPATAFMESSNGAFDTGAFRNFECKTAEFRNARVSEVTWVTREGALNSGADIVVSIVSGGAEALMRL